MELHEPELPIEINSKTQSVDAEQHMPDNHITVYDQNYNDEENANNLAEIIEPNQGISLQELFDEGFNVSSDAKTSEQTTKQKSDISDYEEAYEESEGSDIEYQNEDSEYEEEDLDLSSEEESENLQEFKNDKVTEPIQEPEESESSEESALEKSD